MYVLQFDANNHNTIAYFQCKDADGPEVLLSYLSNVLQGLLSPKLLVSCGFNSFT